MNCLKGEKQNFEMNAVFDGEPVKLLQDRNNVVSGGGSGDDTDS